MKAALVLALMALNPDKPMTKAEFKALSDEEAFKLCFPGIT